jgi:hypothetical protein
LNYENHFQDFLNWNSHLFKLSIFMFNTSVTTRPLLVPFPNLKGAYGSWLHGSWISNYLWNHCLSPLTWVWILLRRDVLNTTLCDKLWQWLAKSRWFSPGTSVSSTNKTDRHDITKILLKVALNTIILKTHIVLLILTPLYVNKYRYDTYYKELRVKTHTEIVTNFTQLIW